MGPLRGERVIRRGVSGIAQQVAERQGAQPDAALEAARTAYRDAILASDLTTADAQAAIIANRTAALTNATLQASAQFEIGALAILNGNGQLTALNTRFGTDRVLEIVDSLTGNYSFGGVGNKSGGGKRR